MKSRRRWLRLVLGLVLGAPTATTAAALTPPPVPPDLVVPDGYRAYLSGHAIGTQNYVCTTYPSGPTGPVLGWVLYGPQATLFNDDGAQVMTHFLSPNPQEGGTPRPTWLHSRDTSAVWARAARPPSTDPAYVDPDAIPWLLLEYVGAEAGPKRGTRVAHTRYLHRVNTAGGKAPATGCSEEADIGKKSLVPYEADYFFYRAIRPGRIE